MKGVREGDDKHWMRVNTDEEGVRLWVGVLPCLMLSLCVLLHVCEGKKLTLCLIGEMYHLRLQSVQILLR